MRVQDAQTPHASSVDASDSDDRRLRRREQASGSSRAAPAPPPPARLPTPSRTREDQARRQRCPRRRAGHELQQMPVADDVTKRHTLRRSYHLPPLLGLRAAPLPSSSSFFFVFFLSSLRRRAPKTRDQKPRFFFGSSTFSSVAAAPAAAAVGFAGAPVVLAAGGGRPDGVGRDRDVPASLPKMPASRSVNDGRVERTISVGLRAADEVLGVDHRARLEQAVAVDDLRRCRSRPPAACPTSGRR